MENQLQVFNNPEFGSVRTLISDNEYWFVGKDVALALEYAETANMRKLLEKDEYREIDPQSLDFTRIVQNGSFDDVPKNVHRMLLINESGVYNAAFNSTLPKAKEFKHWVTSEILPTIRKTGGYVNDSELFVTTYLPFADENTKNLFRITLNTIKQQNEKINELEPKAEFYNAVADSKSAISIQEMAKVLECGFGQNKMFEFLRQKGLIYHRGKHNYPYQEYVDRGYFNLVEQKYDTDKSTYIRPKILVYPKGIDYIRKLLEKEGLC